MHICECMYMYVCSGWSPYACTCVRLLESSAPDERVCPMCAANITVDDIKLIPCPPPSSDIEA